MRELLLLYDYKSKLYKLAFYKKRAVEKPFSRFWVFTMFYVTNFMKKLPFAQTNFQTSNKVNLKVKIEIPKMTK